MKSWKLKFTMILDMVYSVLIIQYFNIGISLPFPIQGASARFSIFLNLFPTIVKNLARHYYQRTPGLNVFLGVSGKGLRLLLVCSPLRAALDPPLNPALLSDPSSMRICL